MTVNEKHQSPWIHPALLCALSSTLSQSASPPLAQHRRRRPHSDPDAGPEVQHTPQSGGPVTGRARYGTRGWRPTSPPGRGRIRDAGSTGPARPSCGPCGECGACRQGGRPDQGWRLSRRLRFESCSACSPSPRGVQLNARARVTRARALPPVCCG